jgi:hypothetical protein
MMITRGLECAGNGADDQYECEADEAAKNDIGRPLGSDSGGSACKK